ncbi:MAG: hypothetical protein JWN00_5 [Actinomycetia bacterium]|nr:hypothetical protein [Actinomycetes bacterium]
MPPRSDQTTHNSEDPAAPGTALDPAVGVIAADLGLARAEGWS